MKKPLIIRMFLFALILLPSTSSAGLLNENTIRNKVIEEYVEDVLLLNNTISGDDITFCASRFNTFEYCTNMFPEAKYVLDTDKKIAIVVAIDSEGNKRKSPISKIERIFFNLIFERYDAITASALQKQSSETEYSDVN